MAGRGEAFFSRRANAYMLAGALFQRAGAVRGARSGEDLSEELIRVMTAL